MFNANYNIGQTQFPIENCIGSDLYKLNMSTVYGILDQKGMPFWFKFATSVQNTSFTASNAGAPTGMDGKAFYPTMQSSQWQSNYYSQNASSGITNPCMFMYRAASGANWDNRICGSTDNHLSRITENTRTFAGNVLQSRILVPDLCCDTTFENAIFTSKLNETFKSLMGNFFSLVQRRLIDAMFSPVLAIEDGVQKTKTFIDDTDGREIDLSTAAITLQDTLKAIATLADINTSEIEYFWFVPKSVYQILLGLDADAPKNGIIGAAHMMNVQTGWYDKLPSGLEFCSMSNIKIIPMNASYFPVDSSGNIVTPMIPQGSIAYSIDKPSRLTGLPSSQAEIDVMSLSESQYTAETQQMFTGANVSRIEGFYTGSSSAINYNGEFAFFTSFVAGRLSHPDRPMYRVLLSANPTAGTNPAPPIPITNPASPSLPNAQKATK